MSNRALARWRSRRAVMAASSAVALLAGLTACGDDEAAAAPCTTEAEEDSDGPVELRFSWWGSDERAELTQQVIDAFEAQNSDITVNPEFQDWDGYWTDLTTQAAGGGLPDIIQMDYSYIQQFNGNQLLADLQACVDAGALTVDTLRPGFLETGTLNDQLVGVPLSGNTLGTFYRPDVLEDLNIDPPQAGWTWDDFHNMVTEISQSSAGEDFWGGGDYTGQYHFLDMWLRQQGGGFYTEDGELGFDEATMTEWFNRTADLREQGMVVPPEVTTELAPVSAMGAGKVATEIVWDNFAPRYYAEGPDNEYALGPIPTDTDSTGQYLKPGMLMSVTAHSQHPNEAAQFVDFFLNSPEAAAILGTDRGIPATEGALDAVELTEVDQQVLDFEASVFDDLAEPPPPPPPGAGSVEVALLTIHEELSYGELTVDEAVSRFFSEAQTILDENRID